MRMITNQIPRSFLSPHSSLSPTSSPERPIVCCSSRASHLPFFFKIKQDAKSGRGAFGSTDVKSGLFFYGHFDQNDDRVK